VPLRKGADPDETIPELHEGRTYKRTRKKRGKKKADKQAIAIALKNAREGKKGRKHHKRAAARR